MSTFSVQGFLVSHRSKEDDLFGSTSDQIRIKFNMLALRVRDQVIQNKAAVWTDQLNRAVLGYPQERQLLRGKISTTLRELGVPEGPDPCGVHDSLSEAIFAELVGMNVLEKVLLRQAELDEIQVIGTQIFEVVNGIERRAEEQFSDVAQVERLQQNLVLFNQDRLNLGKRWAEVQLADGSRVTMTGLGYSSSPTVTIRFYNRSCWSLDELEAKGAFDSAVTTYLRQVIQARQNIVIIGPTNSGKTMLMKALVAELSETERLVTIESRRELMLLRDFPNRNVVEYEIDETDPMHDGAQAFKLALRQSPRRILFAEIRDEDANHYVRACTRGHQGSMTTLHASELEDVPDVLAEMCMQDGRPTKAESLVLRIARHVVRVGIEAGQLDGDGRRGIVRIVKYRVDGRKVLVDEIVRFDARSKVWIWADRIARLEECI